MFKKRKVGRRKGMEANRERWNMHNKKIENKMHCKEKEKRKEWKGRAARHTGGWLL